MSRLILKNNQSENEANNNLCTAVQAHRHHSLTDKCSGGRGV